jgi:putative transcriptional regulator
MEENRRIFIRKLCEALEKRGFVTSDPDLGGLVSFELIARREQEKYIIKILHNVDTFRILNAVEMVRLSRVTGAAAVVIGERAGNGLLEDGVVYYRHRVPIMSPLTFMDYVDGRRPNIFSGPGGFYIPINGVAMHTIRERLGYSIGFVSNKVGTSRRSISLYEGGSASTIDVYTKLEELLKYDISSSIDILKMVNEIELPVEDPGEINEFIREVIDNIVKTGYDFYSMKKAPFDAIANRAMDTMFLIGLFESLSEKMGRALAIKNVSEIFQTEPLIITRMETTKDNIAKCPVVSLHELREASSKDSLEMIIERKKNLQ